METVVEFFTDVMTDFYQEYTPNSKMAETTAFFVFMLIGPQCLNCICRIQRDLWINYINFYPAGNLVAVQCQEKRLGCSVKVHLGCSCGCRTEIPLSSSDLALRSHGRTCVSLGTALWFMAMGIPHISRF